MELYPLKFEPIFHYRIWGGQNLKNVLNKSYTGDSIGESWEISAVPESETQVSSGIYKGKTINQLSAEFKESFLGDSVYKALGTEFPLLIKFIDSKTPLSIQVHPDDQLAKERHNSLGKNEMWYIMPSEKDASITVGFKEETNSQSYKEHLTNDTLTDALNTISVKEGDAFYIPTGRVHAIGAGVMLAEIQQSSDITYRIYDYNRVDASTGKKRELHTELAATAIDFKMQKNYETPYDRVVNQNNQLIWSPYFKTNFLSLTATFERDLSSIDSFVIYMCVKGQATLSYNEVDYQLNMGETILLPAAIQSISLSVDSSADLLEIFM
jgi:mannose-6-phosphate isomerase